MRIKRENFVTRRVAPKKSKARCSTSVKGKSLKGYVGGVGGWRLSTLCQRLSNCPWWREPGSLTPTGSSLFYLEWPSTDPSSFKCKATKRERLKDLILLLKLQITKQLIDQTNSEKGQHTLYIPSNCSNLFGVSGKYTTLSQWRNNFLSLFAHDILFAYLNLI